MAERRVVLLSGPVACGKTELGDRLVELHEFVRFKTHEVIKKLTPRAQQERRSLQKAGDSLDRRTKGAWLRDYVLRALRSRPDEPHVLVDAVRIKKQIDALREAFGAQVVHVHLTASPNALARRYRERAGPIKELKSYDEVAANPTERKVERLARYADLVLDTDQNTPDDVFVRVASHLGFYSRGGDRLVDVLVGGQFGSEGKGQVAAYLAHEYDILVRTGGPNAGHKVYMDPAPYTFHHLPSGTQANDKALVVLGPGAVLNIESLQQEIADCELEPDRLKIDPQAMIIEPSDLKNEEGLVSTIGSTGQGVGRATSRKIMRTVAKPRVRLAKDVKELEPYRRPTLEILDRAFLAGKRVFVEGTQGTGLSLHHGQYPHVTSRDCSVGGVLAEAGIPPSRIRRIIVVCRTYPIRVESPHGSTSGGMSVEIDLDTIAQRSGLDLEELEKTERTSTTNRSRRIGEFDWALFRRSVSLNSPTDIAVTFVDYLSKKNRDARRFDQLHVATRDFIEEVERVASAPVSLISTRFHYRSIIDRRNWRG